MSALGALTVVGAGASTAAEKSGATVIKMERDGKELFFEAPATVAAGTDLKIKNKTNPRKVGPHTFSLVHEKDIPTKPKKIKACSKKLKGICGAIAIEWHEVDLQTGEIGENPVEVGKQGWDKEGSLKRKGDSWVSEARASVHARGHRAARARSSTSSAPSTRRCRARSRSPRARHGPSQRSG